MLKLQCEEQNASFLGAEFCNPTFLSRFTKKTKEFQRINVALSIYYNRTKDYGQCCQLLLFYEIYGNSESDENGNTYKKGKVEQAQQIFGTRCSTIRHHFEQFLNYGFVLLQNKTSFLKTEKCGGKQHLPQKWSFIFGPNIFLTWQRRFWLVDVVLVFLQLFLGDFFLSFYIKPQNSFLLMVSRMDGHFHRPLAPRRLFTIEVEVRSWKLSCNTKKSKNVKTKKDNDVKVNSSAKQYEKCMFRVVMNSECE